MANLGSDSDSTQGGGAQNNNSSSALRIQRKAVVPERSDVLPTAHQNLGQMSSENQKLEEQQVEEDDDDKSTKTHFVYKEFDPNENWQMDLQFNICQKDFETMSEAEIIHHLALNFGLQKCKRRFRKEYDWKVKDLIARSEDKLSISKRFKDQENTFPAVFDECLFYAKKIVDGRYKYVSRI